MERENEGDATKDVECPSETIEDISTTLGFAEKFFTSFSFVYDFNNIKVLSEGRLGYFPDHWIEWASRIHKQDPAFSAIKTSLENPTKAHDSLPEDLQHFLREGAELRGMFQSLVRRDHEVLPELPKSLERGVGEKKSHEVARLARFIARACRERGVGHVVDVGSGVGHLGRALSEVYGLTVSCLEGDAEIAETAERREKGRCGRNGGGGDGVRYHNLRIGSDSAGQLEEIIAQAVGEKGGGVALVGLHCCGDLSADAIRIFLSIPSLSLLALVPCCFHKASLPNASMSGTGVAASPFMRRLAVQDSFSKWKAHTESEHERHMRVFGYRAILEDFIRVRDISVDKKRRRGRRTDSTETFKSWLSANFVITGEYDEEQLESCARKYSQVLPVLEFITGLQQSLQDLALTHLVVDRVRYLLEQPNVKEARVFEIFDAEVSSVNKLLFCTKDVTV